MAEENDKEHGRRTTEEHDRTKIHKQNCKLTYRMPMKTTKAHEKRMAQGNDRMQ